MAGGENLNIGGVVYGKGLVKEYKVTKDSKGNSIYNVTLESGAILKYGKQEKVTVKGFSHRDILFRKDNHLVVNGLKGGTIFGSDGGDAISLQFCDGTTVNVRDEEVGFLDKRDIVMLGKDSKNITVISDSNDEIQYPDNEGNRQTKRGGLDFKW